MCKNRRKIRTKSGTIRNFIGWKSSPAVHDYRGWIQCTGFTGAYNDVKPDRFYLAYIMYMFPLTAGKITAVKAFSCSLIFIDRGKNAAFDNINHLACMYWCSLSDRRFKRIGCHGYTQNLFIMSCYKRSHWICWLGYLCNLLVIVENRQLYV